MRLIRHGEPGREKPGILDSEGRRRDCSTIFRDWDRDTFRDIGRAGAIDRLRSVDVAELPLVDPAARWGSCVARPGKVVCIGLNYRDHAAESGMPIPAEPIVFLKASNTVVGPYDDILIPRGATKTDWEVELGIVIGTDARYLDSPAQAERHIAGYCISHDVSERAFQLERGGQWTKGKSCDTFNPLGPWLATADEVRAPQSLDMTLSVNGASRQRGNSRTMIFDCATIVHYLSHFMTLEAGDVISTGTPPGVGMGMKPQRWLAAGDVVELSITHLGTQRQTCRNA